jgi:ubiquinone biosynthesis protein UbiJ
LVSFDLLPLGEKISIAAPGIDAPDATLRASLLGFLRAKMRGDLMHGDLELQGDSHISVRAARLLSSLKPDIEVALAPKLGGIVAHQIARLWHSMRFELKRMLEHHTLNKADFLHDEINVSPRQAELEAMYDRLDPLQNRLATLEARIHALEVSTSRGQA